MTGRKILFYKRDEEHMVKPSFSGAHQGIFHKWGVWQNVTVGIVESVEGTIFMTHPEFIRFAELIKELRK